MRLQIWFFSWGFYALGDDDTLERKLTGQPARLRSPPPETEEGDKRTTSCKSSDVLARTTGTEGTVSEGSTQKAAADDMVAIDINVQLDDALMAPSSARPGHRGTNGVDSAYNGGGGGGGGGEVVDGVVDGAGVDGGEHMVGELVVAAGCAADGVPPRNEDSVGLPPARTIPQGKNGLAYKRFALNRWRSKRGNSDNSSSSKAVAVSDTAEGGPADSGWARVRQRAVVVLVSPNMIGVAIGIIIAMISPLQRMLFDSPQAALRPLGAAIEVRTVRCCLVPRLSCLHENLRVSFCLVDLKVLSSSTVQYHFEQTLWSNSNCMSVLPLVDELCAHITTG